MTWRPANSNLEIDRKLSRRHRLKNKFNQIFNAIVLSFPVHLMIHHVKQHHILLSFWLVVWAFVSGTLGQNLGISYLFLDPEYLNEVNGWSFLIMGLAFGGFTMAFHITSYILSAYRYTFLGIMKYPLLQFSLNNSLIPVIFLLYYLTKCIIFQLEYEQDEPFNVFIEVLCFLVGVAFMFLLTSAYFRLTRRASFRVLADSVDKQLKKGRLQRVNVMERLHKVQKERVIITSYYEFPFKITTVNNNYPYDKGQILKVFDQTQLNAVIIQIIILISLLILGLFKDWAFFQIPAAASGLLFFSIALMISGAISYWLKEWSFSIVVIAILLWQFVPDKDREVPYHAAFGMDYSTQASYRLDNLRMLASEANILKDKQQTIKILENWKAKFPKESKPKIVLTAVSGGGIRSAIWILHTLQFADSISNNQLTNHTILYTGSSGGLIGAAYYRELYWKAQQGLLGRALSDDLFVQNIGKDKLNSTIFSLVVTDLLFRFQTFELGDRTYYKDRGYTWEQQLCQDLGFDLAKPIYNYRLPEQNAEIPMMIVAPTVINDGRKLYISAQDVSYMNAGKPYTLQSKEEMIRGIEFRQFFREQKADSLRFITALRMNATFPYITPNVVLPSDPAMGIMDAGLSDNFGVADAVQFLYVFRDWIAENTSGVVLLTIRDKPKERELEGQGSKKTINQLLTPLSTLPQNIFNLQDLHNDRLLQSAEAWLDAPIDLVNFQYVTSKYRDYQNEASLSWRLTTKEKSNVLDSLYSSYNQHSMQKLDSLLKVE